MHFFLKMLQQKCFKNKTQEPAQAKMTTPQQKTINKMPKRTSKLKVCPLTSITGVNNLSHVSLDKFC